MSDFSQLLPHSLSQVSLPQVLGVLLLLRVAWVLAFLKALQAHRKALRSLKDHLDLRDQVFHLDHYHRRGHHPQRWEADNSPPRPEDK